MATLIGWMSWLLMITSIFATQLDGHWFMIPMTVAAICNGAAVYRENKMEDHIKKLEKKIAEIKEKM